MTEVYAIRLHKYYHILSILQSSERMILQEKISPNRMSPDIIDKLSSVADSGFLINVLQVSFDRRSGDAQSVRSFLNGFVLSEKQKFFHFFPRL